MATILLLVCLLSVYHVLHRYKLASGRASYKYNCKDNKNKYVLSELKASAVSA
jgi:hypothetical protein